MKRERYYKEYRGREIPNTKGRDKKIVWLAPNRSKTRNRISQDLLVWKPVIKNARIKFQSNTPNNSIDNTLP